MLHIAHMKIARKIDKDRAARIKHVRVEVLKMKSQEMLAEALSTAGKPTTRGAVGNWELGKEVGIDSLAALAQLSGVTLDWLAYNKGDVNSTSPEAVRDTPKAARPTPNASFPPKYQQFPGDVAIPLRGQISAGPNGRFIMNGQDIAHVFCPPGLEDVEGAYAVQIQGTSGEPRFYHGETAWINPHLRVRERDDVIVQVLDDDGEVASYIKRFVSRSDDILRLYQYNPGPGESHDLEFDGKKVFSVHKVVFHALI